MGEKKNNINYRKPAVGPRRLCVTSQLYRAATVFATARAHGTKPLRVERIQEKKRIVCTRVFDRRKEKKKRNKDRKKERKRGRRNTRE